MKLCVEQFSQRGILAMSKAYSNKALPAGTILREWRLEQVLGVGGFGIVYKGRGLYFDELVAIKEYFPSAISERDEDATVVPIDSNSEEVHSLGLKKFVEEAKLLWNLSSPARHPNIVSVRSLFEIHGTAYMVMDFEDGTPLSRLLKDGTKFDEATLRSLILPLAEGLHRAHRVGVLHRDIKPPNIIVNEDGRAVLIDFGSARFESGEATSTTVTFHTPPYAAIEQYVRTYEQGPWTDIYALGVVLYQCVTGEKPAEVLERMHGDAGKPLAEGDWPGFSHTFLAAIDKAMEIHPDKRPRSIPEWLVMFEEPAEGTALGVGAADEEEEDEDATRIGGFVADLPEPEAEPEPAPVPPEPVSEAQEELVETPEEPEKVAAVVATPVAAAEPKPKPAKAAPAARDWKQGKLASPVLLGGAGVAALAVIGGGWLAFGGGDDAPAVDTELVADAELTDTELLAEGDEAIEDDAAATALSATPASPTSRPTQAARSTPAAQPSGATQFTSNPVVQNVPAAQQSQQADASSASSEPITRDHRRRFDRVKDDADDIASEVIRLGRRDRPGSNATEEELEGYRLRQADAETARGYQQYLEELEDYIRSAETAADAETRIQQAEQTRTYLQQLRTRSRATLD
mgnify:CR=1 FL=1